MLRVSIVCSVPVPVERRSFCELVDVTPELHHLKRAARTTHVDAMLMAALVCGISVWHQSFSVFVIFATAS